MKYKLVLFDMDDTLFDFKKTQFNALQKVLTEHGVPFGKEVIETFRMINAKLWQKYEAKQVDRNTVFRQRFSELSNQLNLGLDADQVSRLFLDYLAEPPELIDGAYELTKRIADICPVGIVTNGIGLIQEKRLSLSPIKDFIDFMVVSDHVGHIKPSPQIFECAIQKSRCEDRKATLMIGDNFNADIRGAHDIGFDSCWLNPQKKANPSSTVRPTYNVGSLSELKAYLWEDH